MNSIKTITVLSLMSAFLLLGCSKKTPDDETQSDTCIRRIEFARCMEKIPTGPTYLNNTTNKWDSVIDSCTSSAYYISLKPTSQIPSSCRLRSSEMPYLGKEESSK